LLPGTLLYCFVVIVPICYSLYFSLFRWKSGPLKTFIGFSNYVDLIQDKTFWSSFSHNLYITAFCIVGQIGIALILAILLNSRSARLHGIHRTLCYFPVTLSAVVVGFIWSMLYDYNFGLLNYLLKIIGRPDLVQAWLSNNELSLAFVSIPIVWQYIGFYMIIFLSSFASIDKSILEMAEIDGASGFQRAIHISVPLMKNTLIVALVLCISGNMKTFDHIYVMTAGGPGTATSVMALYAYNMSFIRNNMGYGNALSVGILVLSLAVTLGSSFFVRLAARDKGET
jgi:raffinose/stachyose/melibiose transport system permease protein